MHDIEWTLDHTHEASQPTSIPPSPASTTRTQTPDGYRHCILFSATLTKAVTIPTGSGNVADLQCCIRENHLWHPLHNDTILLLLTPLFPIPFPLFSLCPTLSVLLSKMMSVCVFFRLELSSKDLTTHGGGEYLVIDTLVKEGTYSACSSNVNAPVALSNSANALSPVCPA